MSKSASTPTAHLQQLSLTRVLTRAAEHYGGQTATIHAGRERTWRQIRDRAARLANALRRQGLKPGDRVTALALDSDNLLELFFATWVAGGVITPFNVRWAPREIDYGLQDSGAKFLFVDPQFAPQADKISSDLNVEILGLGEDAPNGWTTSEALLQEAAPAAPTERGGVDLAALIYTGGTTGFPKGVMLSHAGLVIGALNVAPSMRLTEATRLLCASPMFHVSGCCTMISQAVLASTIVICGKFDPHAVLDQLVSNQVTNGIFVPTMIAALLDEYDRNPRDLSHLKYLGYGASPMPEPLLRRALQTLPGVQFIQGYGQTELSPMATILTPEDHALDGPAAKRLRSAGRAAVNCEIAIMDETGQPRAAGDVGEVWVRAPQTMLGYWNKPEETEKTLVDGWCRTGDAGYLDEEHYLYLVDRVKDMIVSGGENIYSSEVENAIASHPAVKECAVIGVPDKKWGETVHAVVVPKDGADLTLEDLSAHCRERIAGYKCPRGLTLRTSPLPLSSVGKVLKTELRAPFWKDRARGVN